MRSTTILTLFAALTLATAPACAQTALKTIDTRMLVAPQITVADVAAAAHQGVTLIVNNRPDGEEPGQLSSADIAVAARAAGVAYTYIPVAPTGVTSSQITAMSTALAGNTSGKTLAFCRSGTRATRLWSLARAQTGDDVATLKTKAAAAGYDLTPIADQLSRVSKDAHDAN